MNLANRIWGIIICGVGVFYLVEGFTLPPAAIGDPLGPLVFPTILGFSFIACGVYLAVRPGPRPAQPAIIRNLFVQILILFALLLLYAFSMGWMGYPIATFLFVVIAASLMGEKSRSKGVVFSAVLSAGIFLLFIWVLNIPLPPGFLKILGFE